MPAVAHLTMAQRAVTTYNRDSAEDFPETFIKTEAIFKFKSKSKCDITVHAGWPQFL